MDIETFPSFYDLAKLTPHEEEILKLILKDHIILIGKISSFFKIIDVLRKYSKRTIILYSNDEIDIYEIEYIKH